MPKGLCVVILIFCGVAAGQAPAATESEVKPHAFEVVSIRPTKPGTPWMYKSSTEPDGYRVTGQSLFSTLMIAYFPQGMAYWSKDRVTGAPPWINDLYDINAKVGEADLDEWQKQSPTLQTPLEKKVLFRQMLQQVLADRFHMVAHLVPGATIPAYALELGKQVPRLTESKPDATLPVGMKLSGGGVMVGYARGQEPTQTFYNATMDDFAQFLAFRANRPVENHTGLTGHYDFVMRWADDPDSTLPPGVVSTDDTDPIRHWDVGALGFHLQPIRVPADTLVIDHIERPTEN